METTAWSTPFVTHFFFCDRVPTYKKSLQSHVKHDDYFGTLAMVLALLRFGLETHLSPQARKRQAHLLTQLERDLGFLQKSFVIQDRKMLLR